MPTFDRQITIKRGAAQMDQDTDYRVKQWKPPARPDWVQGINQEGSYLDLKSVVPLDENSLISSAVANTGLSDFGSEDWYEPFKVLIKSFEEEAELNLMGRLMTRSDLLMHLEARLKVEDMYKRHPEIDDEEISAPLMIIGSGRVGTSAIQNLLSRDPGNGTPKHWEAMFPVPAPQAATYHSDPRIDIADKRMTQWIRVAPEFASMHEFGGDMPTEMGQIEVTSFQTTNWMPLYGFTPTYNAYISQRSAVPGFQYCKRVFKLLQWKNPRQRWLLKSPMSLVSLPDLFAVFPDLRLIWMHRDPIKAVSSLVSLIGTLYWIRSDRQMGEEAIAHLTNPAGLSNLFNKVIDEIERGEVPVAQVHNVQYSDFVNEPMKTVEALYRDIGIPLTGQASQEMRDYIRDNPRQNRPPHNYSVGDIKRFGEERKLFDRYQKYFDVKNEV